MVSLYMEVIINCTSTFGTQPRCLYREVVSECKCSLRQALLYDQAINVILCHGCIYNTVEPPIVDPSRI